MVEVRAFPPGAPDEVDVARELAARSERRDEHPALGDEVWRDLHTPAPTSSGFVATDNGEAVGYLRAIERPEAPLAHDLAMTVHPDHRDDAVPGLLLDAAVDFATERGSQHVSLWAYGADVDTDALAFGRGLAVERELWQMRVPLPLASPQLPDGVRLRSFVPGVDDDAWLDVNNRSFVDDPDQRGWTRDTLAGRMNEGWFDPDGFLIADDGGRMAGFCWTKVHPSEPPHEPHALGEIYVIGVAPEDQGRGLGRALVLAGLASLAARGIVVGMLFVDAANEAAVGLYRALGFVTSRIDRAYGRDLTPGA